MMFAITGHSAQGTSRDGMVHASVCLSTPMRTSSVTFLHPHVPHVHFRGKTWNLNKESCATTLHTRRRLCG